MRLLLFTVAVAGLSTAPLYAQGAPAVQVHGFVTQSGLFSDANNYLAMDTSEGSAGWTEAAVNVNTPISDKVRIGAQLHLTKLGKFDDWAALDWALIDYRASEAFGLRAGRVKIPWGLYNDEQDADPGYLWSLLPEPIYAVDWRATDLAQWGAEVYGRTRIGERFGELDYSVYYGYYAYSMNDGYMETFREDGLNFSSAPWGKTPGFDLRWRTPLHGLTMGGSLMVYDARGTLPDGSYREPTTYWPTYYALYEGRRFFAAAQYMSLRQWEHFTIDGEPASSFTDTHAWFAMGGYHLTNNLQVGAYYTRNVLASAADQSDPENYYRDWVVSGRYDFDRLVYLKLEGHFMDGSGAGFYSFNNPDGITPRTKLVVAKIGVAF